MRFDPDRKPIVFKVLQIFLRTDTAIKASTVKKMMAIQITDTLGKKCTAEFE